MTQREALIERMKAAQAVAPEVCKTCGSTEPYTGSCGTSDGDTKALCKRKPQAAAPAFTTGHCKNKAQPGGCQLHNLQCGYPECDRQAAVEPPQYRAMWLAVKEELDILKLRGGNGEAGLVTATAPSEDSYSEPPHPTQPVATMWREKNTKLYPGIVFGLTDAGKDLPLGVRHQLYTSQPDNTAEMEALRKANLDCVDHFNVIKADYEKAQKAMRLALERMESFALWADSQADAQSKGGHATFDIMELREQRDLTNAAIAALEWTLK